jgi:O-antigen/teichoic acid export membrane protein
MSNSQKQSISLIAGKMFALVAAFVIPLFLARYLSKADYGIYARIIVIMTFIQGFFSFEVGSSLYYFYPLANPNDRKIYIFQAILLLFILSFFAAFLISFPWIGNFFIGEEEFNNHLTIIIILTIITVPSMIITALYVIKNDYKTSILYPATEVVLRAGLVILFVILMPGVESVFDALIVSATIIILFILYYAFKKIDLKKMTALVNKKLLINQISYSLPFGMANSIRTFSHMFDKIICISYLTSSQFATYSIAFYGIPGIMQIYDSLVQVKVIQMTKFYHEGNNEEVLRIYKRLVTQTFSFTIPVVLIVALYAEKIIRLFFTAKFVDSTPLFQVYLFTVPFMVIGAGVTLRAIGKTKNILYSYLFGAILSIPVTYILLQKYGMWGALFGAMFSFIIPKIFTIIQEIKLMNAELKDFFPWKEMLQIIAISIMVFFPFAIIEREFKFNIIISGALAIIYLLAVVILEIKFKVFVYSKPQLEELVKRLWMRVMKVFKIGHESLEI